MSSTCWRQISSSRYRSFRFLGKVSPKIWEEFLNSWSRTDQQFCFFCAFGSCHTRTKISCDCGANIIASTTTLLKEAEKLTLVIQSLYGSHVKFKIYKVLREQNDYPPKTSFESNTKYQVLVDGRVASRVQGLVLLSPNSLCSPRDRPISLGDEVLRQGIQLYSESRLTKKMAD